MRKTLVTVLLAAATVPAATAQNYADALRYGQNEYFGTARSMAMGNAFTALGGDLGSVGINPAGSAVNKFSQFEVTPAVSVASGKASYESFSNNYGTTTDNSDTKMTMPNVGMSFYLNTGSRSGLKGVSFAFVGNATSYYLNDMTAGGNNSATSYMGYLAAVATNDKMSLDALNAGSYWDYSASMWPEMVGYRSSMISIIGEGDNGPYVGSAQGTESGYPLMGTLRQTYGRQRSGCKYDLVFNMGFNIDDRLFLGANLGVVSIDYRQDSWIREVANDPEDFALTFDGVEDHFESMAFHESYEAQGAGIYGKFGFIYLPVGGLRIGGAIQTPTANYITETLWYSGETKYTSGSNPYEVIGVDDQYEYEYKLVTPWRFNVGLAYTIPGFGAISADYEMCDYSSSKFRDIDSNDNGTWVESNQSIHDYLGVAHELRLGAEWKATQEVSVRAGYDFMSSPERYFDDNGAKVTPAAYKHTVSLGLGYSSSGSFFCDLAGRMTIRPDEYIYPYSTYNETDSPEITNRDKLLTVALTLGWRF